MNAKAFALGLIFVFLAWCINKINMPTPGIGYWQWDGITIPYPTIVWWNPLGFVTLPMTLIGAILIVFGLFKNTAVRIILTILATVWVLYFKAAPILGVMPW